MFGNLCFQQARLMLVECTFDDDDGQILWHHDEKLHLSKVAAQYIMRTTV